jgi:hypothetical protein
MASTSAAATHHQLAVFVIGSRRQCFAAAAFTGRRRHRPGAGGQGDEGERRERMDAEHHRYKRQRE